MAGNRRAGRPTPSAASGGGHGARAKAPKPARRPDPPPLDIDESKVILVGVIAWSIALIVMLAFYGELHDHDREWWIFTAIAGLGLGCWGWFLVRQRIEARRAGAGAPEG